MSSRIFRQASLERLNSPEQLDSLIQVTQPRGWLAISMVGVILVLILTWSFIGSVPTRVNGQGILIRSGGMMQVVSMSSGQIQEIVAEVGDMIKQGQVVARIHKPEILNRIHNMRADLLDARKRHERLVAFHDSNLTAVKKSQRLKRANLEKVRENLRTRQQFLSDYLAKQIQILERGLVTPRDVDNTQNQLSQVQDNLNETNLAFLDLENSLNRLESDAEREILNSRNNLDEMARELRRIEGELKLQSQVKSTIAGRVVEVSVKNGDVIGTGSPILVLEDPKQKMEALVYVNPADGKKITTGMEIDISPSTVKPEEYGSILGLVTHVSQFPASPEVIRQAIPNPILVETLLAAGAPIEVHADLIPDHRTPTGYKWTSSVGPKTTIEVGTMAQCSMRVKERRPITLVLPYLKKLLGLY